MNIDIKTLLKIKSGEEIAKIILKSYVNKEPIISIGDTKMLTKHLDREQKKIFEGYIYLWLSFRQFYPELATNLVQIERDLVVIREFLRDIYLYYAIENKITSDQPEPLQSEKIREILSILSAHAGHTDKNGEHTQRIVGRLKNDQIFLEYVFGMYNGLTILSDKVEIPLCRPLQPLITSLEFTIENFNCSVDMILKDKVNKQRLETINGIEKINKEGYKKTPEFKSIKQMLETYDVFRTNVIKEMQFIYEKKYMSVFSNINAGQNKTDNN